MSDQEFMLAIVEELKVREVPAFFDYPGFLNIPVDGHISLHAGTADEFWSADIVDHDGYTCDESETTELPRDTRDLKAVADWLACCYTKAVEACQ